MPVFDSHFTLRKPKINKKPRIPPASPRGHYVCELLTFFSEPWHMRYGVQPSSSPLRLPTGSVLSIAAVAWVQVNPKSQKKFLTWRGFEPPTFQLTVQICVHPRSVGER